MGIAERHSRVQANQPSRKGPTMIQLTDSAITAVRSAIAGSPTPVEGLRLIVEAGGCAGLKYSMGLVAERQTEDMEIDAGGIRVFVDPASGPYLDGTVVDFVTALEGSGFTFENPNATSRCSCGKSFG